jgi:hypothetical protein
MYATFKAARSRLHVQCLRRSMIFSSF